MIIIIQEGQQQDEPYILKNQIILRGSSVVVSARLEGFGEDGRA